MPVKAILNKQVITDGSMTGTSTITSTAIRADSLSDCSVQFVWTGTPNGTFTIQGSNDGTTFTDVTLTTSLTATGAAGSHLANLDPWPFKWFQCKYVNSSSTGTLQAIFHGKEQ